VALKPVAGVLGGVSAASQGFATKRLGLNLSLFLITPNIDILACFQGNVTQRIRPPRFICPSHPAIKPYSRERAEGQLIVELAEDEDSYALKTSNKAKAKGDTYVTSFPISKDYSLVLTDKQLLYVHTSRLGLCLNFYES